MSRLRAIIRRTGWNRRTLVLAAVVGLFLVLFLVVPLAQVFHQALWPGRVPTLDYLRLALQDTATQEGLRNALLLAVVSTLGTALLSLPLALANVRLRFRGKGLLSAALLVPMILPPFVGAIGMRQLLGPLGVLNAALAGLGLTDAGARIDWFGEYPLAGVILLQVLHLYPIMYLNLVASLANVDPSLEEAARNLGAGRWAVFRRITFPLMLPGVFAGAILVFIWALTDLGTPLMFDFREVISVQIFFDQVRAHDPVANARVVILLVIVAVVYTSARLTLGRRGHEMMARSVQTAPARRAGTFGTLGCWLLFGGVVLLAALPHIMVLLTSVSDQWFGSVLPPEVTLDHHVATARDPQTVTGIRNSLLYAVGATGVCVVVAVWSAYVLVRRRFVGRTLLDAGIMLPLAVPGLVLAFGFLTCYHGVGQWLVERGVWRTNYLYPEANPVLLLVVAYAVRRLPYMARSAVAGFQQTSRTLEEAAMNLGAGPVRTLLRVTVPLVAANLVAGSILVFTFSMLEVSDSLLLARQERFYPLTKVIYQIFTSEYRTNQFAISSALGVWAMALLAVSLLVSMRLLGRRLGAIFRA